MAKIRGLEPSVLLELGFDRLTGDQAQRLWNRAMDVLRLAVGNRLAVRLTSDQLDNFQEAQLVDDEPQMLRTLEMAAPAYRAVVAEESAKLFARLRDVASRFRPGPAPPLRGSA